MHTDSSWPVALKAPFQGVAKHARCMVVVAGMTAVLMLSTVLPSRQWSDSRSTTAQRLAAPFKGIATTCPHPYDAVVPQLWEHRVTQPGHYMIEPGGLTGSGVGGHGGPAIAAGQQEHGSGGKGSDGDAAPTEPELYLCYAMEGGLFNQYYSHVSALAAAVAIGAKGLIMPPVRRRMEWTDYAHTPWEAAPVDSLWDLASLQAYAAARGVEVVAAPAAQFPAEVEFPPSIPGTKPTKHVGRPPPLPPPCISKHYRPFSVSSYQVVAMPTLRMGFVSLDEMAVVVRTEVQAHMARLRDGAASSETVQTAPQALFLSFPSLLFGVLTRGQPLMTEVATNLRFSPHLQLVSQRIMRDIVQRAGTASYNAMHLRVEADALQFLQRQEVGGADAVWQLYTDAALRAGFSAATPMFVASGIFNGNMSDSVRGQLAAFTGRITSVVLDKTPFLTEDERTGFNQEQLGAIDFLILAKAQRVVVFDHSSMSMFAVEYRRLHGFDAGSTACVLRLRCKESDPKEKSLTNAQEFDVFPRKEGQ